MAEYEDSKSDDCTTCSDDCSCTSCCEKDACGCKMELDAKCIRYTGRTLECLNILLGENLETVIQKLEEKYCELNEADCEDAGLALYQLWLDAGNVGTIEDFLNTVVGSQGDPGVSLVWLGDFAVAPPTPNLNEAYYDSVLEESFVWDGVAWQTIAKDGIDGLDGTDGLDGVSVLHNDMATYSRAAIGFLSMTNFSLPAGTLSTDGSKIKIDILYGRSGGSIVSSYVKLQINGVDSHITVGDLELDGAAIRGVFSYELHRKTNSTAVASYTNKVFTATGDSHLTQGFFENEVVLGVLDFDNAATLIDILGSGDGGVSTLEIDGFSVENYIK